MTTRLGPPPHRRPCVRIAWAAVSGVVILLLAATGCAGAGDREARASVESQHRTLAETVPTLYRDLASATGDSSTSLGDLTYVPCGMTPFYSGVESVATFTLESPSVVNERLGRAIAETLRSQGWNIPRVGADTILGTKGRASIAVSYAGLATFRKRTGCIDTSQGLAEAYGERPTRELSLP